MANPQSTFEAVAETSDSMLQLCADPDFHFETLRTLALATTDGADVGEVLVAAKKVKPLDMDSYYQTFYDLAERVHAQAKAINQTKYPTSARSAFFKASTYYRAADFYLHGNWEDPRIYSIWDKALDTFNNAMKLLPVPGQRITLQAKDDNFTIPAIFFGCGRKGPRPTIILGNGFDGSQEEMYHLVGKAALERGMNVITYEGPGQPTVRREQNRGFIPQWERVVTPVVDYLLTRPEDVDPKKIALCGFSFGGYLAPRAAAFEHRLAAVFAIDGLYSFGRAMLNRMQPEMLELHKAGKQAEFDEILLKVCQDPSVRTSARWGIQQGMWSFYTHSPYKWLSDVQQFDLDGIVDKIQCPVFVANAEDDSLLPDQAEKLAAELGSRATYHSFMAADGAGAHCSLGATTLQNQIVLDWFSNIVEYQE